MSQLKKPALNTSQIGKSPQQPPPKSPRGQAKPNQKADVDTTWMVPGALVWLEQQANTEQDETFIQGQLVSFDATKMEVQITHNNKTITSTADQILERADPDKIPKDGFQDMVNMEVLNDAELLENVRKRYMQDLIMTYVGPTLLVVNPFKKMPQNISEETRIKYIKHIVSAKGNALAYKELPPHVYAISSEAYRSLFENDKPQAIVISGESGAGKTENAKFCMSLLTSIGSVELFQNQGDLLTKDSIKTKTVTGTAFDILKATIKMVQQEDDKIEDKILSCNPILEAFGNSKTKRNNNSSRFGKYVRMFVDKHHRKIRGAQIVNYLLEKSRIIFQGLDERNFHIFYHIYEGSSIEELKSYKLANDQGIKIPYDQFEYLKKAKNYVSPGIDDKELFLEFRQAVKVQFEQINNFFSNQG